MKNPKTTEFNEEIFVEQAEYLAETDFKIWNEEHPNEKNILSKLKAGGAKLITGPRGSGKTTLLLKAYHSLLESASLPVYVNFKASLKLEPLYRRHSNATFFFNSWLILKVYKGISETLENIGTKLTSTLKIDSRLINLYLHNLESGLLGNDKEIAEVTHESLDSDVTIILQELGKSRCVLLLDDAAHAFSPEQQRDFFDFFRRVKSKSIAPKAAIYPGVTTYSASFHVGHDAEEINAWIQPETSGYIDFMKGLIRKRLQPNQLQKLEKADIVFSLLCYAAFGMPRSLLNMVRYVLEAEQSTKFGSLKSAALQAIQQTHSNTLFLFQSLQSRLPMYTHFIENGEVIYFKIIELIKKYNSTKDAHNQSVIVAINTPIPNELGTVLSFFQYSGLILPRGQRSRGSQGVFEEFVLHYATLIERNALFAKRALNSADYVHAFENRSAHAICRTSPSSLINSNDIKAEFPLALPPCHECGEKRHSEHAKFCQFCGAPLKEASIFESLVKKDISQLPLTANRVSKIKKNSKIRIIQDILIDNDHSELRGVPHIGPIWATRIYSYAEEFIA